MRWNDLSLHPTPTMLYRFGGVGSLLLAGAAAWQVGHDRWILAGCLLGPALVLAALAWSRPGALRLVFVGLVVAAFPINWVVGHLTLALIFYGVFTPVALWFKWTRRDFLALRRRSADSYWVDKPSAEDIRSYFRQS